MSNPASNPTSNPTRLTIEKENPNGGLRCLWTVRMGGMSDEKLTTGEMMEVVMAVAADQPVPYLETEHTRHLKSIRRQGQNKEPF